MRIRQRGHTMLTRKIGSVAVVLMLSGALLAACGVEPATPNVGVTNPTVEALIPEVATGIPLTTPVPPAATVMPTNNPMDIPLTTPQQGVPLATPVPGAATATPTNNPMDIPLTTPQQGVPLATPVPGAATATPANTANNQAPTVVSRSSGTQGTELLTVRDVPDDPSALIGTTMAIRGQLANVIGARAFVLRDLPTLGNDQLLIIAANDQVIPSNEAVFAQGGGSQAAQNQSIVVTGTLRLFNLGAIQDEIGADLQDSQFSQYAGQPVMIANKVEVESTQLGTNP